MCILSRKITDLLDCKKTPRLQGSATVAEAMEVMDAFSTPIVGVECEEDFVGIFKRSDYRKSVIRQNLNPKETTLYEVMTASPPCLEVDVTVKEAYEAMLAYQWEFMPIVRDKCLHAIVSFRELGKHIMNDYENKEAEYRMVINYFKGGESYGFADYDG